MTVRNLPPVGELETRSRRGSPRIESDPSADAGATLRATVTANGSSVWRPRIGVAIVLAIYLGLGVLANLPVWTGGVTHTLQCGACGDRGQEVWFLAWAAHAVTHLQDPLRTNWINYPFGVDLADNTSMPLAGAIGTPVTLLFGPVATFNVLFSLAFAGSASAAFFLLRRFTAWTLAAFIGGLLYGFSPYMIGQGNGHLFLLLVPVPPLMLLVLDEIVVRQQRRWWLMGAALGLLMIIQLGWSAELLASTLTVAAVGVVVLAMARPRLIWARLPYAVKAIGLGFVLLAPVAVKYALISRTGPEAIPGSVHPVKILAGVSTDLAGLVVPSLNQHFSFGLALTGTSFLGLTSGSGRIIGDIAENGSYVGIPILLLLAVGWFRFRRDGLLCFSVVMAGLALLLSMGSYLHVWGHDTRFPLPFAVLTKLPFVQSEVASRYSLFMWLFIAVAVAVILDRARRAERARPAQRKLHSQGGRARPSSHWPILLVLTLGVLGVVSLVPGWPYQMAQVVTPAAFVPPTVDRGSVGSTLLTYPLARTETVAPMVWQAIDRFQYRIPAGEAAVRYAHKGAIEAAFDSCALHSTEQAPAAEWVSPARAEFATWQVRTVVIPETDSINPACAVRFVREVLGRGPAMERGSAVWNDVDVGTGTSP